MNALIWSLGLTSALVVAGCVGGQVAPREGVPEADTHRFDPGTIETVDGQILGVDRTAPSDQLASGVHLTLGRAEGPIAVDLGPGWYLDRQGLHFAPNERVQVRGSRVQQSGKSAIVAQEITARGRVIQLRDRQGHPLWRAPPAAAPAPSK